MGLFAVQLPPTSLARVYMLPVHEMPLQWRILQRLARARRSGTNPCMNAENAKNRDNCRHI